MTSAKIIDIAPAVRDGETRKVPLRTVIPAADNVRRQLGDLVDLVASVKAKGVLQRIVVTPAHAPTLGRERPGDVGLWLVIMGHRRRAAAEAADLAEVPIEIRLVDERERLELMLHENLQRSELTPLEEAHAFRRLAELGDTQREIAEKLKVSQGHVSKRMALLELPEEAIARLDSGGITVGQALELHKLKDHPKALARALNPGKYNTIEHCVAAELGQVRREAELAARTRELEAKGLRVVRSVASASYQWKGPNGTFELVAPKESQRYYAHPEQVLLLDPKAHASEPCHAVGLCDTGDHELVPLCTDRKRHKGAKTKAEHAKEAASKNDAKRDREDEKREEMEQEAQASGAFVERELVKRLGMVGGAAKGCGERLQRELIRALLHELLANSPSLNVLVAVGDRVGAPKMSAAPTAPAWGPDREAVVARLIDRIADAVQHREVMALHALLIDMLLSRVDDERVQEPHLLRVLEAAGHKLGKHELAALERERAKAQKTTEGGGGKVGRARETAQAWARPAPTSPKKGR